MKAHKCLIYIISPSGVISSLSAVLAIHKNQNLDLTILVHWPGVECKIVEEIRVIISELLAGYNFIRRIVSVSTKEKNEILNSCDINLAAEKVRIVLGCVAFDEIYYAHDIEGGMFQLLCTVYPEARRICFGDALGIVFEKDVHLSFYKKQREINNFKNKIKNTTLFIKNYFLNFKFIRNNLRNENTNHRTFCEFKPDEASLILPVDQSGNFLKKIPLTIPDKNIVMDVIKRSILNASDLKRYIGFLISKFENRNKWLLLTDNFAEGDFIDFNKEVEMWISIIKNSIAPGSVIFLKSHPGETLERNQAISERIGDSYFIVELNKKFKRYPIEIWYDLIINCRIICMSYPILSLKYLYNIDVKNPMDDLFIEKWFKEWTWDSYKNARTLYMEPLKLLTSWDGKSILYAGDIVR